MCVLACVCVRVIGSPPDITGLHVMIPVVWTGTQMVRFPGAARTTPGRTCGFKRDASELAQTQPSLPSQDSHRPFLPQGTHTALFKAYLPDTFPHVLFAGSCVRARTVLNPLHEVALFGH